MEIEMAARARNPLAGLRRIAPGHWTSDGDPFGEGMRQFRSEIAAKAIRPLCDLHH
jgi:hypothetical protein